MGDLFMKTVYILRLSRCNCRQYDAGILGVFSSYNLACDKGRELYQLTEDGATVWVVDAFEVDENNINRISTL
jgi:hypothetical protein